MLLILSSLQRYCHVSTTALALKTLIFQNNIFKASLEFSALLIY